MPIGKLIVDLLGDKKLPSHKGHEIFCIITVGGQSLATKNIKKLKDSTFHCRQCVFDIQNIHLLDECKLEIKSIRRSIIGSSSKTGGKSLGMINIPIDVQVLQQVEHQTKWYSIDGSSDSKEGGYINVRLTLKTSKGTIADLARYVESDDYQNVTNFLKTASANEVNTPIDKSNKNTILHIATLECQEKDERILCELLKFNGINVNAKNLDGNTALHYFCAKWKIPDIDQEEKPFQLFIQKNADVNATNVNGESPIFKAIFNDKIRTLLMEGLIKAHADLSLKNEKGLGVLHYAVHMGRSDLVNLIAAAHPDIDAKGGEDGTTPYQLALKLGNQAIAKHLSKIRDLFLWLDENGLGKNKGLFIQHAYYKDVLADVTEVELMNMGIHKKDHQNILHAIKKLNVDKSDDLTPSDKLQLSEDRVNDIKSNLGITSAKSDIDGDQLEYLKKLGSGAAGEVYKGLLKMGTHEQSVAIKVLKEATESKEVDEFKKEYSILSAIEDKNVVKLFGVSFKPRLCMVMEYCARGSLYHVLKDETIEIGWSRTFQMAIDSANGVKALHTYNPQILHRDLKTLNLMVTQDLTVKVGDFGLSRFNEEKNLETMKQMRGTFAYLCPEVYLGQQFTVKSDIYAVGIILWELAVRCVTRKYSQPYSEFKNIQFDFQIIIQSAKEGKRPTIPGNVPDAFVNLIKICWDVDPDKRPDSVGLVKAIKIAETQFKENKGLWEKSRSLC